MYNTDLSWVQTRVSIVHLPLNSFFAIPDPKNHVVSDSQRKTEVLILSSCIFQIRFSPNQVLAKSVVLFLLIVSDYTYMMDILYVDQTRSIVEKVNDFYNWTHSLSGIKFVYSYYYSDIQILLNTIHLKNSNFLEYLHTYLEAGE